MMFCGPGGSAEPVPIACGADMRHVREGDLMFFVRAKSYHGAE